MGDVVRKSVNEFFVGRDPYFIVLTTSSAVVGVWAVGHVYSNFKGNYFMVHVCDATILIFLYNAEIKATVIKKFFSAMKAIPGVDAQIKKQTDKAVKSLRESFTIHNDSEHYLQLPENGLPYEVVLDKMRAWKAHDETKYKEGKVSGCIYLGDDKHTEFLNAAYSMYSISNPLHPDVFPTVKKFEGEVIKMTANMMHGDDNVCGAMTSGGTERYVLYVMRTD